MSEVILCDRCKKEIDCSKGFYNTPLGAYHGDCWAIKQKRMPKSKKKAMLELSMQNKIAGDIVKQVKSQIGIE